MDVEKDIAVVETKVGIIKGFVVKYHKYLAVGMGLGLGLSLHFLWHALHG